MSKVTIIKETRDYVKLRRDDEGSPYYPIESKEQKLLCVGGPFAGQRRAACQLGPEIIIGGRYTKNGYWQYNRGEYRPRGTPNKAVYVHESVLTSP